MVTHRLSTRTAFLLGVALAWIPGALEVASAAEVHFIGGADDTQQDWEDTNNWSPAAVPGAGDDVVLNSSDGGALILEGENETILSLDLNTSLSVARGGSLTVTGGITNNGPGYFTSDGTVTVKNGGTVGTLTTTYTNVGADADPDNDYAGYVGNTNTFVANVDNSGAIINGDGASGLTGVTWAGNVINRATGAIINTGASWTGDVTSNAGGIFNDYAGQWTGDVLANDSAIENTGESTWSGKIVTNSAVINNITGATWTGDVEANDGSVNNDGGTWNGNVVANSGTIFNTSTSVWNGNIYSTGSIWLSGTVNGDITNDTGGTMYVNDPLNGVKAFTNNGALTMQDGDAHDFIEAQSWAGTGTASLEFAPGEGRIDHVVLSGDYTGHTAIDLSIVGPSGRAFGDIPLIEVGGTSPGTITLTGLPEDGVISYRLVHSGASWIVATTLTKAPEHAAAAAAFVARTTAAVASASGASSGPCESGRWVRALGATQPGALANVESGITFGGAEMGYDLGCSTGRSGVTVGGKIAAGLIAGHFSQDYGVDGRATGEFEQLSGGLSGTLAKGHVRASLTGQVSLTGSSISDPSSAVDAANLASLHYDLSGKAMYDLPFGEFTVAPEVGLDVSNTITHSGDFADVGALRLVTRPTIDVHTGTTVSGNIKLADGMMTLRPFVNFMLHDEIFSPDSVDFIDDAGGGATLPFESLGTYGTIALGADLFRATAPAGRTAALGVSADLKFGSNISEHTYAAYLRATF